MEAPDPRVKATLQAMQSLQDSIQQQQKAYQELAASLPEEYRRPRKKQKPGERTFKHPRTGKVRKY